MHRQLFFGVDCGLPTKHCETHIPKNPQISVAPASFPQSSFCYFPAAICRREDAFEGTDQIFIYPSRLSPGSLNCSIPEHFPVWVTALQTFPPCIPKCVEFSISYLGSGWEQFCTHTSIGAARLRVRKSHILYPTIYGTAGGSQSRHNPTAPCLHHVEKSLQDGTGIQRGSTRPCCSLI